MEDTKSSLSFRVLSLLSKERGVYGLRNGDYDRYRRHCSNKLRSLRVTTSSTNGKGKQFKKAPAITSETVKDVKSLQLLLFSAERALAHSHAHKAALSAPNTPPHARRDQISRLRRALSYATELYNIGKSLASSSQLSQQTLTELTIYYLSVRAELSFEQSAWPEAVSDLAVRRKLLSTLAAGAKDSRDQALANEFIDQYDPLIRFCAYKMGRTESHDIEGVVADFDDEALEETLPGLSDLLKATEAETKVNEKEAGRKQLEDVSFAGDKVEMRNAEIVAVMLKVQAAIASLGEAKDESRAKAKSMRRWDTVLATLGDAEVVARRLVEDNENSTASSSLRSARTSTSLSHAHQYIVYLLLSNRVKRDLLLVGSSSNAIAASSAIPAPGGKSKLEQAIKDLTVVIKLYDTVLQSLGQMRGLALVEEKEEVKRGVEGLEAYFRASRCYHLARLHTIHPTPSFASAIQLLSRSSDLAREASDTLSANDVELKEQVIVITDDKNIGPLRKRIEALESAAKRALFAERVDKPLFFDTAFNYIDLPMDELHRLGGKASTSTAEEPSAIPAPVKSVVEAAGRAVETVKAAAVDNGVRSRNREATPSVETESEKPKGWLGGWFGKK